MRTTQSRPRSSPLSIVALAALGACVERAAPVNARPDATAAVVDGALGGNSNTGPSIQIPVETRDGQVVVAYRAPLRACDEACLRGRGGPMLRLLRLAHQMPPRIRRVLQAMDMPYARVWMAWLARFEGDDDDARTYLTEARALLQQDAPRRAAYQSALARIAPAGAPTLDDELVAEMRTQLDHWASLDPELGAEMSRVLPCAVLARSGAGVAIAFRPSGAAGDGDAQRTALRCGEAAFSAIPEASQLAARSAVAQTLSSITALTTAPDASAPASDGLRLRVLEPFFAPAHRVEPLEDAALSRFVRSPQGAAARATLPVWLRSRSSTMTAYASALCLASRQARVSATDAQCAERARNAVNSAAKWWIESSANVAVGERERDR
ncbi:MAG: hypothetical protein U0269_14585 [Polyangiales bacterium]